MSETPDEAAPVDRPLTTEDYLALNAHRGALRQCGLKSVFAELRGDGDVVEVAYVFRRGDHLGEQDPLWMIARHESGLVVSDARSWEEQVSDTMSGALDAIIANVIGGDGDDDPDPIDDLPLWLRR